MTTAIFITVRLKSTRLPGKALLPLHGRPLLGRLVDRLRESQRADLIALCTSDLPEDDPLEVFARQEGLGCFRGDPDDVLLRLRDASRNFSADVIASCTGDNPFVDAHWLDRLVEFRERGDLDYSRVEGLPFGTFSYCVKAEAVALACELKGTTDTEVWGGYFTAGHFRTGVLPVDDPELRWPGLRLTVDTHEDYRLARTLFSRLHVDGRVIPLKEIVDLCRREPGLTAVNSGVRQKPAPPVRFTSRRAF